MTETVALNEAKTQLSALLRRVEAGEEIIIRRGAIPVARLIPERPAKIKPPGSMRGRIWMAEDFDDPLAMFDAYRGDPV